MSSLGSSNRCSESMIRNSLSRVADHAIVRYNGKNDSRVSGTVFELSADELESADQYEPSGYERILAPLASGK